MIDRWIFHSHPLTVRDLAIYRILYASFAMLMAVPRGLWLEHLPDVFFSPPASLAAIVAAPLPFEYVQLLNVLLALSLAALLIGWYTRTASISATVLMILLNTWIYSPGKINHDILFVLVPAVMAFSGWGEAYSIDARRRTKINADSTEGSWTVTLMSLLIGIALFTAGWAKLSTGWLDLGSYATYGHLLINYHVTGRHPWGADLALQIKNTWFWEALDWSTVLFEVGFLPAVLSRRSFLFFCALAAIFHVGVELMFAITFWPNLVAYGVVIPYSKIGLPNSIPNVLTPVVDKIRSWPAWYLLAVPFCCALHAIFVAEEHLAATLHVNLGKGLVYFAAAVGVWYLGSRLIPRRTARTETA